MNPGRDERDVHYVTKKKLPRSGHLTTDKVNMCIYCQFYIQKYYNLIPIFAQ